MAAKTEREISFITVEKLLDITRSVNFLKLQERRLCY